MDPDPEPDLDPELPEKSDPNLEIIFLDPTHCLRLMPNIGRYLMSVHFFANWLAALHF